MSNNQLCAIPAGNHAPRNEGTVPHGIRNAIEEKAAEKKAVQGEGEELKRRGALAADYFKGQDLYRHRTVGRRQRRVSWASIECLIIPDWGQVKRDALTARMEDGAA